MDWIAGLTLPTIVGWVIAIFGSGIAIWQTRQRRIAEKEAIRLRQGLTTSSSAFERRLEIYVEVLKGTAANAGKHYDEVDHLKNLYSGSSDALFKDLTGERKALLKNRSELSALYIVGSPNLGVAVREDVKKLDAVVAGIETLQISLARNMGNEEWPSQQDFEVYWEAQKEHHKHGEKLEAQMRDDLGVQDLVQMAMDAARPEWTASHSWWRRRLLPPKKADPIERPQIPKPADFEARAIAKE